MPTHGFLAAPVARLFMDIATSSSSVAQCSAFTRFTRWACNVHCLPHTGQPRFTASHRASGLYVGGSTHVSSAVQTRSQWPAVRTFLAKYVGAQCGKVW